MQTEEILADYEIRKLGLNDRIGQFDCGDEDLNDSFLMTRRYIGKHYWLSRMCLKIK